MVVNLIPSFGSVGFKLVSPVVLRESLPAEDPPKWELYDDNPEKLPEEYPYSKDDVLFPPPPEVVKKDATVFEEFLASLKSLKVPPPIYDTYASRNRVMTDEYRYNIGPAGERLLLHSDWKPNDISGLSGRIVNIDGTTFYVDGENNKLHWLNNGTVYTYLGMRAGIAFLEDKGLLENPDMVKVLEAEATKALIQAKREEAEANNPYPQKDSGRRRLGRGPITY
jgi:hypothetical protein